DISEPIDEEASNAKRGEAARGHDARLRAAQAPADNERIWRIRSRLEQARNLVRIVLAVAVERDDAVHATRQALAKAAPKRLTLAATTIQADDIGAGGGRHRGGVIGGAVVDDEHTAMAPRVGHDRAKRRRLVERRNDDEVIAHAGAPSA